MKLLALDTSSNACSVALMVGEDVLLKHEVIQQQANVILFLIEELLSLKKLKLNQLDAIAFGCGPGSFTGLRVAASVVQGLAYAASLPVIAVSSLAVLAQTVYDEIGRENIAVAVDARMQEVYWGFYQAQENLMRLSGKEQVIPPSLVVFPQDIKTYGVGNGWDIYQDQFPFKPSKIDAKALPKASSMLALAKQKYLCKEWLAPAEAVPVYLRDNVAKKA